MRAHLYILGAVVLPLVWGWMTHRLVEKFWPSSGWIVTGRGNGQDSPHLGDYQI